MICYKFFPWFSFFWFSMLFSSIQILKDKFFFSPLRFFFYHLITLSITIRLLEFTSNEKNNSNNIVIGLRHMLCSRRTCLKHATLVLPINPLYPGLRPRLSYLGTKASNLVSVVLELINRLYFQLSLGLESLRLVYIENWTMIMPQSSLNFIWLNLFLEI